MADWRDPSVSRLSRWVLRLIALGTVALVLAGLLYSCGSHQASRLAERCMERPPRAEWGRPRALAAAQQVLACVEQNGGTAGVLIDRKARDAVRALPSVPCRYVGTWAAFRPGTLWEVELRDDSSFRAKATLEGGRAGSGGTSGAWGVADERMVWLYDNRPSWPPELNPIRDQTDLGFTLVEADGSTTRFVLVRRPAAPACKS